MILDFDRTDIFAAIKGVLKEPLPEGRDHDEVISKIATRIYETLNRRVPNGATVAMAYTSFQHWPSREDDVVAFGNCVNCGKPYGAHLEIRDDHNYRALCSTVGFLKEKRKDRSTGGRRKAIAGKHND